MLPLSTCLLYLRIYDIAWLVRWLGDELRSGGVPLESSDPVDALECNCAAENVHARWELGRSREAMILQGVTRRNVVKTSASGFTQEKCSATGASARYGTVFGNASSSQKTGASYIYLEIRMKM